MILFSLSSTLYAFELGTDDAAFLDRMQKASFVYFNEQTHPVTGLVADRALADGSSRPTLSSIAATGFGLTSLCVATEHGWIDRPAAEARALATVRFIHEEMPQKNGFFYHFVHNDTGKRFGRCELSSIDTALLLAGVLTVRQYFDNAEIKSHAKAIYDRIDWNWMRDSQDTLSMGWTPERGFLRPHWIQYNECMLLYLLAMGSDTHAIPPESWLAWKRTAVGTYAGQTFIQCPPLFTHQYSHAWVDFRNQRDDVADYFRNSVYATLAQRQFCIDQRARFSKWTNNLWGLTAADTPAGYRAFGAPLDEGHKLSQLDGTLMPCAPGGSLPFAPAECLSALRQMHDDFGDLIYKHYGFVDSFNPETGWFAPDVIGIDVGITLLMTENLRSEMVWKTFMKNGEIAEAMKRARFRPITTEEQAHLDLERTSLFLK
jgi:hypothetical protein